MTKKYQKIHAAVNDHPIVLIYFSRFLTSIAPTVNVISGTTRLSYKKYLTFEVLGECTEVAFFSGAGYIFGTNWEYLNKFSWEFWAMFLFAIIFVYLSGRFVFKRRAVQS